MDDDIKQWQDMWSGQDSNPPKLDGVISQLVKAERKNKRDRIIMIITFPLTFFCLLSVMPVLQSPLYMISLLLITGAMLMILLLTYRTKLDAVASEEDFSNKVFLENQVKKLKGKMKITSYYMWIYVILLVLGINIGYIEALRPAGLGFRFFAHSIVTVGMLVGMYFGIKQRMEKYKVELEPLIEQLEFLQKN